jgi:hypothetical protein
MWYIDGHYSMTYDKHMLVAFYKILVRRDIAIPVDLMSALVSAGVDVSALDAELTGLTTNGDSDYGLPNHFDG